MLLSASWKYWWWMSWPHITSSARIFYNFPLLSCHFQLLLAYNIAGSILGSGWYPFWNLLFETTDNEWVDHISLVLSVSFTTFLFFYVSFNSYWLTMLRVVVAFLSLSCTGSAIYKYFSLKQKPVAFLLQLTRGIYNWGKKKKKTRDVNQNTVLNVNNQVLCGLLFFFLVVIFVKSKVILLFIFFFYCKSIIGHIFLDKYITIIIYTKKSLESIG